MKHHAIVKKLEKQLGIDFIKSIPSLPGVYQFKTKDETVIYVGKAVKLKRRLNDYFSASTGKSPRKMLRMLKLASQLTWEVCESEEAALLKENQYLRSLKPRFNIVNKTPESYFFIALRMIGTQIRFRLTTKDKVDDDENLFGAYKGRTVLKSGLLSLYRLIWYTKKPTSFIKLPFNLRQDEAPYIFNLDIPPEWIESIKQFFAGTNSSLLHSIMNRLLENEWIDRKAMVQIDEDFRNAKEFYRLGPERTRKYLNASNMDVPYVGQAHLDDLEVFYRSRQFDTTTR